VTTLRDILRKAKETQVYGQETQLPDHIARSSAMEVHDSKGRQVGLIALFGDEVVSLFIPQEKLDLDLGDKIKYAVDFMSRGEKGLAQAKEFFNRKYGEVSFKSL